MFKSAEHCYQFIKACFHKQFNLASDIKHCSTPLQAKSLSKQIKCIPSWTNNKLYIMWEILKCKYEQVNVFNRLLNTIRDFYLAHTVRHFLGN